MYKLAVTFMFFYLFGSQLYAFYFSFPPLPWFQYEFTRSLSDVTVRERDNAIFECVVSHANVAVQWFVNSVEVVPGPKYQVIAEGLTHRLAINKVTMEDAVEVKAVFRTETSVAKLVVERE